MLPLQDTTEPTHWSSSPAAEGVQELHKEL